ncbi:Urb2/Npa2 family-domain-containing protein [Crucibulum laeve]|uniref:Urb2/Npa2 family-domain-containing protein n=1 Tax=Crucibulum laeve TaxID=68775 RepID=A0A5C3M947_9AGAR|nr:Urb2/Npa2 family-domain-containing protein [Crucibulum laeve]
MSTTQSSQNFVRALKASSDPPTAGGPAKIEIARQAWDDASFYVPSKFEVVVDWILTRFLKDKGKESSSNSILDLRYWTLLSDVVTSQDSSSPSSSTRFLKTWLATILHRVPIAPIVGVFLHLFHDVESSVNAQLSAIVSSCLTVLWPLGTLLECWGALLEILKKEEPNQGLVHIGILVTNSYRHSLSNSSNKKKIYTTFLQTYLERWLQCVVSSFPSAHYQTLLTYTFNAGSETLFNIDKYRGTLFSQGSTQLPGTTTDEWHAAGMRFFASCQPILEDVSLEKEKWPTRVALLSIVDHENLFHRKQLDGEITTLALQALTVIAKIDYELVLPAVPRMLPRILLIPSPNPEHFAFLELLLEYHIKTRSMNAHVSDVLSALSSQNLTSIPGGARKAYQLCLSGPLLHNVHLTRLSKALQKFITASQCLPMVNSVIETIRSIWEQYHAAEKSKDADNGEGSRKKRRSEIPIDAPTDPELLAVVPPLLLPSSISLPNTTREEVRKAFTEFRDEFLRETMKKSLKLIRKRDKSDVWAARVVASATLRFNTPLPANYDAKVSGKLLDSLEDDGLLPELSVEIFRNLLYHSSTHELSDPQSTIDKILTYLQANFKSFGSQMDKLIRILMSIKVDSTVPSSTSGLRPQDLLMRTLRSAQFWELHNVRTVFLAYLTETTSPLETKNFSEKIKPSHVSDIVSVYRLLLLFPVEYFSRSSRADFIKRALAADVVISELSTGKHYSEDFLQEALIILRVFLKRMFSHAGAVEQQSNEELAMFLEHLIEPKETISSPNKEFISATLDLVELYLSELLKLSQKTSTNGLLKTIASFSQHNVFDGPWSLRSHSLMRMVDLLNKGFSASSLPEDIQLAVQQIHSQLTSATLPRMSSLTSEHISEQELINSLDLTFGWHCLLTLGKWLDISEGTSFFGQRLASKIVALSQHTSGISALDKARISAMAIILQELHYRTEDESTSHLDLVVTVYISFARTVQPDSLDHLDELISKTCKALSPSQFAHVLGLVSESLITIRDSQNILTHLVHLSAVLLHEHPQSTLKHMQTFMTKCLNAFANNDVFINGPVKLRLQVLKFISQHCSDRPAALRLLDLSSIWSILSGFLAPSTTHDPTSTLEIFHKLITILNSLTRLRRDLVTPMLPHLSMLLRQLLLAMRSAPPHLGAKQTALVTSTLPRWLIGLLETLNSKTLVRSHASSTEGQKAESLAKPFSKHAAHVLKAYIEAMNDPFCILPLELRKELQPGLYALCSTTMKALWKEYESQRYVGKG